MADQSLQIRLMTPDDIPHGMALKRQAGWNQLEADWCRFLSLQPDGCFVVEWDGRVVATVTTSVFDSVGWIAMVLVNESDRGKGIATKLMDHALEFLDGRRVETVRLDATALGQPVYEKLGFVSEYSITRFEGTPTPDVQGSVTCPLSEKIDPVISMDRYVTGADRGALIKRLVADSPESVCYSSEQKPDSIKGFAILRAGALAWQLGPVVAIDRQTGKALGDHMLSKLAGQHVYMDIPDANVDAVAWAKSHGFTVQRQLIRMRRGNEIIDHPQMIWAGSGPEKG